uniref:Uncharacterized protein n=1 Tax=Arundo donax TaxID=35708 RepID=A0A0A9NKN8_ARUDO
MKGAEVPSACSVGRVYRQAPHPPRRVPTSFLSEGQIK